MIISSLLNLFSIDKKEKGGGGSKFWVVKGRLVWNRRHRSIWTMVLYTDLQAKSHCWFGTRGIPQSWKLYLISTLLLKILWDSWWGLWFEIIDVSGDLLIMLLKILGQFWLCDAAVVLVCAHMCVCVLAVLCLQEWSLIPYFRGFGVLLEKYFDTWQLNTMPHSIQQEPFHPLQSLNVFCCIQSSDAFLRSLRKCWKPFNSLSKWEPSLWHWLQGKPCWNPWLPQLLQS